MKKLSNKLKKLKFLVKRINKLKNHTIKLSPNFLTFKKITFLFLKMEKDKWWKTASKTQ